MDLEERIKLIDLCLIELNKISATSTIPELLNGHNKFPRMNSEDDRKYRVIEHELERLDVAEILKNGDKTAFGYHFFGITPTGIDVVISNKSVRTIYEHEQYLKEREQLEFRKLKTDLSIAERIKRDYPWTKWLSRIGAAIGIILAIIKLVEYLPCIQL